MTCLGSQGLSWLEERATPHLCLPSLVLYMAPLQPSSSDISACLWNRRWHLKCIVIVTFHPQEELHLYPCTSCPQSPAWGWLLLCTPWDVQQEGTVYLGIIMVSAPLVTHRKSLPTTLVATAPTAVIVLQVQEQVSRKEHLSAREAPQNGSGCESKAPTCLAVWGATAMMWDLVAEGYGRNDRAWLVGWTSVMEYFDVIWLNCSFNGPRLQTLTPPVSI